MNRTEKEEKIIKVLENRNLMIESTGFKKESLKCQMIL